GDPHTQAQAEVEHVAGSRVGTYTGHRVQGTRNEPGTDIYRPRRVEPGRDLCLTAFAVRDHADRSAVHVLGHVDETDLCPMNVGSDVHEPNLGPVDVVCDVDE